MPENEAIRQYAVLLGLGPDDPLAISFALKLFEINQRPEKQRDFPKWSVWDTLADFDVVPRRQAA